MKKGRRGQRRKERGNGEGGQTREERGQGSGEGKWMKRVRKKKWESLQCALRMLSFLSTSETGTKVINLSSVLTHI